MARKQPDAYDELLAAVQPPSIADLVRVWAATNHSQICDAAFGMMRSPSGTRFTVAPLTFVGFAHDDARAGYYLHLIDEFKKTRKGRLDERTLALFHVERLAEWLRAELERQLTAMAHDADALTYYHGPKTEVVS